MTDRQGDESGAPRDAPAAHWALSVPLPSTRQIGPHAVGRVLVALALDAGADGTAWPGAESLAACVSGLTRRDVRNALDALEAAGLIVRVGRVGRAVRWQLAGYPAYLGAGASAGYPADPRSGSAGEVAGQVAGDSAGEAAGNSAGSPATKGSGREGEDEARASSSYCPEGYPIAQALQRCADCRRAAERAESERRSA